MSLEVNNNDRQTKYKRNKKKRKNIRFLRNAKGFAKQNIFGRGTEIKDDQYNYFLNILESMENGFEDVEEKVNMANNVFEQTQGSEVHFACNQIVSKVLESLLGFVEPKQLEIYFVKFADSFRPLFSDRFASHVLQKMVEIAFLRSVNKDQLKKDDNEVIDEKGNEDKEPLKKKLKRNADFLNEETYNLETDFTVQHKTNCGNFVLKVGKFMLNNLEDFVWDRCATHIMRTSILCLAGIHVPKVSFEKNVLAMAKNRKVYQVSDDWHEVAKDFAQRLQMWPQFCDLPYQNYPSALLSALCIALKVIDEKMLKHLGKKILMEALLKVDVDEGEKLKKTEFLDDEEEAEVRGVGSEQKAVDEGNSTIKEVCKLPKVFEYKSSIVLLETLLTVSGQKLITQLYLMLFANKLALLSKKPSTNFVVQKLLGNIKVTEDFENIFLEIQEHLEELLKIGHTGVIIALSSACLRLQTKQAQLLVALQSALHINGDKERLRSFFTCLLKLKPFEIVQQDTSTFVHLHGSLLIQDILRFNKPILLVNCILETPPDNLVAIFNTPHCSYICDAFLQSKFIGEKSREKLLKHLEGFYVDLAINQYGSHVVEGCFKAAHDTEKAKIVKELANKLNKLKGSPFGVIINNKLRIETYRLSANQWKASMSRKESMAQQFKNIIN